MSPSSESDCHQERSLWEQTLQKIISPIEQFIHYDAASGLLLMGSTLLALALANSPLASGYHRLCGTVISFQLGPFTLSHSLQHWINDGLMTLFFFLVGMEIKREILVGELARLRNAILPIGAAFGGMVVPALIYWYINLGGSGARGWAIPMATDIAFALGVLVLLGNRVPKALSGFLLALAIADDLGAILVIALFYTQAINGTMLLAAAFLFGLLLLCNGAGIRQPLPYFLLGGLLWLALLHSGIHATLAGVLTALTVPAKPQCRPSHSLDRITRLLSQFTQVRQSGTEIIGNDQAQNLLYSMERDLHNMSSPLQRLIHVLHPWSAFLVIPLFALVNSGIPIPFSDLLPALRHPVTLGIMLGLIAGKASGVFLSVWLLTRAGISSLPAEVSLHHVTGVSLLAGIGFTMSIFIGELSFVGQESLLLQAKTGILLASLGAGICGYCWLFLTGARPKSS